MGNDDKKPLASNKLVKKHLILLDTWGTTLIIYSNSTETPGKAVLLVNSYSQLI